MEQIVLPNWTTFSDMTGSEVSIQSASPLSTNKFSMTVIKAREVVSLNESFREIKSPELKERLAHKFDRLLGFLVTQFHGNPELEDVRGVLSNKDFDALNEDELSTIPDSLIPVCIVRSLMRTHRVIVDPRKMENWHKFQERYASYVLHA